MSAASYPKIKLYPSLKVQISRIKLGKIYLFEKYCDTDYILISLNTNNAASDRGFDNILWNMSTLKFVEE